LGGKTDKGLKGGLRGKEGTKKNKNPSTVNVERPLSSYAKENYLGANGAREEKALGQSSEESDSSERMSLIIGEKTANNVSMHLKEQPGT